jgi:hypothetical protein
MKSKLKTLALNLMMMLGMLGTPLAISTSAYAVDCDAGTNPNKCQACEGITQIGGGNACKGDSGAGDKLGNFIQRIINVLLFVVGAISVLMIIIGGLRYVLSGGDQNAVSGAKNTILYAVIGLIVAIMAYAIVNFVVAKL